MYFAGPRLGSDWAKGAGPRSALLAAMRSREGQRLGPWEAVLEAPSTGGGKRFYVINRGNVIATLYTWGQNPGRKKRRKKKARKPKRRKKKATRKRSAPRRKKRRKARRRRA